MSKLNIMITDKQITDKETEVSNIFETMKQEIRDQMFIDSLSVE